jgi:dTDP-4-amino-4,6-dideoxygalactose transaminase
MMVGPRDSIAELEWALASKLGRKHCVVTGRGASAIYVALKAIPERSGKVIVPVLTCPSPATVPLYAGLEPLFCDVRLSDCNMDPEALGHLLETHVDVVAIMPVHLYGQAAPLREILALGAKYGVPVIEDAAQALGGAYEGKPLGSFGDISIISFGHTKTLDVGWGGAALTDDDALAEGMRRERDGLPARPRHINRLFEEYRKVYYSLSSLAKLNPDLSALFVPLPEIYRDMYLFRLQEEQVPRIREALGQLEASVAARRSYARRYREGLQHKALRHPVLDEQDAPWRYSFLVGHGLQRAVTEELRAAGVDASNWYPLLNRWYVSGREQDPKLFRNAAKIAVEVVNLWVAPNLPEGRIEQTCEIIQGVLAKFLP